MDKKWDLMSLSSIPLIMTLGNSMLIPVLPTIKEKLRISSLQVSLIITSYACVSIVLIPIACYLSDRLGRKKIIIPSLIIAGLGGLLSGLACWRLEHSYLWILIGRVLKGLAQPEPHLSCCPLWAGGRGHHPISGTPEQIANQMQYWFEQSNTSQND